MASRQPEQSLQATTAALIAHFQSRIANLKRHPHRTVHAYALRSSVAIVRRYIGRYPPSSRSTCHSAQLGENEAVGKEVPPRDRPRRLLQDDFTNELLSTTFNEHWGPINCIARSVRLTHLGHEACEYDLKSSGVAVLSPKTAIYLRFYS